ncbi:mRNA interferase PemK-like protein [Acididesulfobacillus acetoxydans]|uniref:mRNA interferase n=1 Tax=Acididesulfobacillus acetoxydans TaxID=1561005 RepID=A0A8S0W7W9_9FIRM|nr:type II toxin-antitoxin system PemK/MazF family toxin [Acididesulfobacillus acetoxydans]CAA7601229.1 mRNA interferase PemK-like protein [Acididesulfobacillus acetoxydans]CEJ08492.1 PemK-like protein [Acididesulfobacillus acetoxydans]
MNPRRGDVWLVNLNPVRGHEQSGTRPALIFSVDLFNCGPAGLVVVLPITTRSKGIPFHVEVQPPEGGLTSTSYVKCEDIRSVSKNRLANRLGALSPAAIELVEDRIQILLGL